MARTSTTATPLARRLRRAVACLVTTLAMLTWGVRAPAQTYNLTTEPGTAFETVTTDVVWELTETDYPVDDDRQLVPIGFPFLFGGVVYTQVRVMSNAVLHFGANQGFHKDYTNTALPIRDHTSGPGPEESADRVIAGYWDDLEPSKGGSVRYDTLGTAPNRRFVASWQNVPHYNFGGSYSVQIVIYEDGTIRFRYGAGNATGASATIGVEVDDDDYTQFSYNTANAVGPGTDLVFSPYTFAGGCPAVFRDEFSTAAYSNQDGNAAWATPWLEDDDDDNPTSGRALITGGRLSLDDAPDSGGEPSWAREANLAGYTNATLTFDFAVNDDIEAVDAIAVEMSANGGASYTVIDTITGYDLAAAESRSYDVSSFIAANTRVRFRVAVEYHGALESILLDNVQIEASGGAACACVSVVETFADRFSVDSFSNDDGDQSWSGAWIEVDGDGAGPNDGNVEVHNGELILDDRPDTGGTPGVQREADLSAYASATLEFAWATTDDVDSSDAARVEISANGGASWTTLETFTGITGENNATRSFDITPYIAANTRIRFRITANYGGSGEEFHVDDVVIRGTLPCPTVDHFAIAHDGDAVTCAPEPVTLTAHAADHSVETGYEGTVSLSTSTGTGDWALASGNGTLVNAGGGNATYTFVAADSGTVGLTLRHTATGTVDIDVTDGTVSEDAAEDPALAFAEVGFRFLANGVANAIPTQVAGRTAPQTVELEAIRTDTATGACQAALTGAVAVELAFVCDDPGGCVAGRDVAVNGTDIAANPAGAPSSYTAVALDFGDATDTTAAFSLRYPEAGRIRLHARYALPDAGGTPTANLMLGASNAFVVRPFGFDVDLAGDRAANGTAGASFAADAAGSRFRMAGESFSTTVRAVAWSAADDADADGVPDTGADLTDNIATENFGQESAPATASITHALAAPLGGSAGTLSGTTTLGGFSAGAATTSLTWDEVGIVHLLANHADYLGGGAAVTGAARNVGRFYPARLTVTDSGPSLRDGPDGTWTCGFTYMDQPFAFDADPVFTLTARGLAGNVTANYGGAFFKLAGPYLANRGYASSATSSGTLDAPALGTVTLAGESDLDGIATLTLAGETFAYLRGASPEAAFAGSVDLTIPAGDLTDSDGVCHHASVASCNTGAGDTGQGYAVTAITGTELRFGRLLVANAIGSELLPLVVPARAEVWNGAGFVVHTDDGCSVVATAHLDLVNADADPALGVATIAIGAGTTTASFATSTLAAGDAGLAFTAPLAGNTGYTDLRLDLSTASGADLPWLRFDWDGDGAHDDDPTARATFGVYPGSSRVIIVREPW